MASFSSCLFRVSGCGGWGLIGLKTHRGIGWVESFCFGLLFGARGRADDLGWFSVARRICVSAGWRWDGLDCGPGLSRAKFARAAVS